MATLTSHLAKKESSVPGEPLWVARTARLWEYRRRIARVISVSLAVSLAIAFAIPRQYKSTATIMPPDQQNSGAMMLAALAGHGASGGLSAFSGLAGSLLGVHSTTALFIDLLRSGSVTGPIIDRFNLQKVYRKRYRVDTGKVLARRTKITDDKKSGVITIQVEDTSPVRARDMVQCYLDGLNDVVTKTNTSEAHLERAFIETRLNSVKRDLERAQVALSNFSTRNSTIDIKEQTHAMVDASARLQGEILVEQSGLQSLRQLYGDSNIRLRQTQARIASLQGELNRMAGSSTIGTPAREVDDTDAPPAADSKSLYPPLRQLPSLAVPYADLYRTVRVQETVFELLTQQYEMARIEEAKDVPTVRVIDAPGIPEKKSFPPRLLIALALTAIAVAATCAWILLKDAWSAIADHDPRKALALNICATIRRPRLASAGMRSEP